MSNPAFQLTVGPNSVHVPAGPGHYMGYQVIRNDGTSPLTVTPSLMRIATGHACTETAPTWLTLASSRTFTVAPGQSHQVAYTVAAYPGADGIAAVVETARTTGGSNAKVGGAVATRVQLGNGHQTCTAAPRHVASPPGQSTPVGVIVLACACCKALAIASSTMR